MKLNAKDIDSLLSGVEIGHPIRSAAGSGCYVDAETLRELCRVALLHIESERASSQADAQEPLPERPRYVPPAKRGTSLPKSTIEDWRALGLNASHTYVPGPVLAELCELALRVVHPSAPTAKHVRVRLPVDVRPDGTWYGRRLSYGDLAASGSPPVHEGAQRVWVEADVPVPEAEPVVRGEVKP